MSSIEKLSIQGIRSFGAEDTNRQVILFNPPLTVIFGQNGSGKTTIIECLRYIITGDMPPNSGRGGSFVRDPKIAYQTSVKGKISLKMNDMTKKTYYISRSLEVTQHPKDIKFRTLENTISSKDGSGARVQLSSKCADIDREVCTLLGVSKAILNNVIFCHQEESNWPLSEAKALKQRFDDIFAATRYIKALDAIRKHSISMQNKGKEYKIELKYLTEYKEQAAKWKIELKDLQDNLSSSENNKKEIKEKLQPFEKKLKTVITEENVVSKLQAEISKKEAVKGELEKKQNELKQTIQKLFEGTEEELERQISDFQTTLQEEKSQLGKLRKESLSVERECTSLKARRSKLTEQLGAFNLEKKNHHQRISDRNAYLVKSCNELNIPLPASQESLSESDISSVVNQIRNKKKDEEEQLKNAKNRYETLEQMLQNRLDEAKEERARVSHSRTLNSEQMRENKKKILSLTQELSRVDALANKRADLEESIKKKENELEKEESSKTSENFKKKLNIAKKEKDNIEALLNQLNAELSKLQKEHKIRAEADLLMKDKNRKETEINKIKTRYHDIILHLLGKIPDENIHQNVQKYISNILQNIKTDNDKIETKKLEMSSLETTKQHLVNDLKEKQQHLDSDKMKVFRVCGNDNYDRSFSTLEKKIKELQDEKGALIGSQYIFTTYMDKLRNVSPCCPLCHRGFAEDKEAKDLISELEKKMKMVPSQLRNKEKSIDEYQGKLNAMTELRPVREGIRKLEKDIPELRQKLEDYSQKIEKYQEEIRELNETLEINRSDHATACRIQEHAVIWDQSYAEIKRLEDRLSNLTCYLGGADMSRTVQIVCDEQDTANMQLDSVKAEIEQYQRKLEEHANYIQCLKSEKNDLNSELLQITSNLQQQSFREEEKRRLSSENVDLENSIKIAEVKLSELEHNIKDCQKEKEKHHREKEEVLEMLQSKISKIDKQLQDIMYITKEINKYITGKREEELKFHQEKLNEINKQIMTGEEKIHQCNEQMNKLNKELSTCQLQERDMNDNLKLLHCQSELEMIRKSLSNLQDHLQQIEIVSLMSQKQALLKEQENLQSSLNQVLGEQKICEREIEHLKQTLDSSTYRDADQKHHNKLIEIRTNEIATQDLNKYYNALDCAIMRYHNMKMHEINKIIRELWIKTYAGNDIDYIEIRSDAQEGNLGFGKRRTYNYKVVMIKGDIAIDMRGRCSAGQKVLASLIIRLALAETFCLNCGILALDEPTTNLDRDNIERLAQALAEIVQSRAHQSNFQLIVITHDEDFVELLERSDAVDYYYCVSRDSQGMSKITKSTVRS